ncbi:MAG: NAD(P)-dependent alcohol dehydrogenase [Spirochaetes bacterium]|nr:NAD(P)-dependent alcohol dehydrogenase [Spirochaetota bacterium]
MKAMIYERYGSPEVLQLKEIDQPKPKENEVLIKVHAVSLNFSDNAMLTGVPFLIRLFNGFKKPKNPILGADIAGTVEAVGSQVKKFQPGDEVIADKGDNGRGGFAEYVCANVDLVVKKPANVSFEEASTLPMAGLTALQGMKKWIKSGQKVLINGASGGVGSFAVQIAKSFGTEVTAVCRSEKLEIVRSIGADYTIDYTKEDFTKNGQQYDLIIGANGYHPLKDYKNSLASNGVYVCTGGAGAQISESMLLGPFYSMGSNKKLLNMGVAKSNKADLNFLTELLKEEKIKPIIDKCYPLKELPQAFDHYVNGHIKGKVVITMN